jgi:hypothetical protein
MCSRRVFGGGKYFPPCFVSGDPNRGSSFPVKLRRPSRVRWQWQCAFRRLHFPPGSCSMCLRACFLASPSLAVAAWWLVLGGGMGAKATAEMRQPRSRAGVGAGGAGVWGGLGGGVGKSVRRRRIGLVLIRGWHSPGTAVQRTRPRHAMAHPPAHPDTQGHTLKTDWWATQRAPVNALGLHSPPEGRSPARVGPKEPCCGFVAPAHPGTARIPPQVPTASGNGSLGRRKSPSGLGGAAFNPPVSPWPDRINGTVFLCR